MGKKMEIFRSLSKKGKALMIAGEVCQILTLPYTVVVCTIYGIKNADRIDPSQSIRGLVPYDVASEIGHFDPGQALINYAVRKCQ